MKRSVSVQLTREEVESIVKAHIEAQGYEVTHLFFQVGHEVPVNVSPGGLFVAREDSFPVVIGANAQVAERPDPKPAAPMSDLKQHMADQLRLCVLCYEGTDETPEGDALRDKLGTTWAKLNEHDRGWVRGLCSTVAAFDKD